jgi:hypothetical protein
MNHLTDFKKRSPVSLVGSGYIWATDGIGLKKTMDLCGQEIIFPGKIKYSY